MEHNEFMGMLHWLVKPIKQKSRVDCFSWFAKKILNISFAFCLPGAPSEFQADMCPHELGCLICILALPCCCGWDKQEEETIHVKKAEYSIVQRWQWADPVTCSTAKWYLQPLRAG